MKLKRLEILGFKSFADKIVLDLTPGISAIVGPNGCGKSNIVDALRWVMGEQRLKALRGKKTEDVIFNGSDEAAPVGMAEVSMTMEADDRPFPDPYGEFREVMISRRVFRDGESEYGINNMTCRLLDVKEFFLDTGVGARTYSIVEQNSVATLVEAKPEDRRRFIEEAAGIAKYRSRKEAAIRKMEATRQNLLRIHDVLREVKSQLNAVSRQAKRAEHYKALKKDVREAELSLALQSYADFIEKRNALEGERNGARQRGEDIRTSLQSLEAALEALKAEVLETEQLLAGQQEALYRIRNEIGIKEQGLEFNRGRTADTAARQEKHREAIGQLERRREELEQEEADLNRAILEAEETLRGLRASVTEGQTAVEDLRREGDRLEKELEERKIAFVDAAAEKAKRRNLILGLNRSLDDLRRRDERDLREQEEQNERRGVLGRSLAELRASLTAQEAAERSLRAESETAAAAEARLRRELPRIEHGIGALKDELGRKAARLASLKEFQEGYAWCNEATQSLLAARRQKDPPPTDAFFGVVADHLDVPRSYETAVEAVLGDRLQYIVVESQRDGIQAIDYLKNHALGRGSFIPREVRNHPPDGHLPSYLGDTVRLVDAVGVTPDFRGVADYLLGDVLLIPTLSEGLSLWERNGFTGTFVTPEGDIIHPQGVLSGGSANGNGKSLLKNKREISELEGEVTRLRERLAAAEGQRRQAAAELAQADETLRRLRTELHRQELQATTLRKDIERFDDELKRLEQRLRVVALGREQLKSEEQDILGKIAEATREIGELEQGEGDLNADITDVQARWQALRADLARREAVFTDRKVRLASLEEKREADRRALARMAETRAAMGEEIGARRKEFEAGVRQAEELARQAVSDKEALTALYRRQRELDAALTGLRDRLQDGERVLKEKEAEAREAKQRLERAVQEAGDLEMEYREIGVHMDHLRQGMQARHACDLDQAMPAFQRLEASEVEALTQALDKNRQVVENFGEVNLLALNEHAELKERHEFLAAQAADLQASLDTLQATITRINRVSRQRFSETFTTVNERFEEVFGKIFPGGKGRLSLTDESDLLETGVDIHLQIPGKRTQNVTLLSGGEKSLAAIALIFAILLYRPTPFLVLDEVDAALDDANIALFNRLVREIAEHSQVLMITHNKRTMEVAENLYGVTMAKQGVSSLVSVSLQQS